MSVISPQQTRTPLFNLPNQLTTIRLVLSIVLFVLIEQEYYLTSVILFVVAASTDWLDGYYARKYQMVTTLGRILDPFVDKVIVCGTFIYLLPIHGDPPAAGGPVLDSGVRAWMVVVIIGRELLVTALRSFLEQQGADFSASLSGKLKMVLQCVAAPFCLLYVHLQSQQHAVAVGMTYARDGLLWATVALTVISGVVYVRAAIRLIREQRAA